MKSLKERLEEKISYEAGLNTVVYGPSYKEGATSLVPLVVELAEALEFFKGSEFCFKADNALELIEKFLEDK